MNLVASFELNGVHHWPNAPEGCKEFREPHRHLFKFIVWVPVATSRSTELFVAREFLIATVQRHYPPESTLSALGIDFGPSSCEDIAQWLRQAVRASKVFVGEEWFLGAVT